MYKPNRMARNMILVICILVVVFITAAVIASTIFDTFEFLPFSIGVLMGGGVNLVKVILLDRLVERTIRDASAGITKTRFRAQYFLRFVLTGLVLLAAALIPSSPLVLWGAAAGVMTFPLAAYSMYLFKEQD